LRPGRWDDYERPVCGVLSCDRPAHANGLCSIHSPRLRRHGDPEAGRRLQATGSLAERFWAQVDVGGADACWPWTAGSTTAGYGEFNFENQTFYAHRVAYELIVGPIPEGDDVHHQCQHRPCCNPAHLEPLTPSAHRRRHRELLQERGML
jgi:hypothetical protein